VLLAERVVLSWLFVCWSETQYAKQLIDKVSIEQAEFYLRQSALANRQLLASAATLAKVRRLRLPDVMAVVNVAAPAVTGAEPGIPRSVEHRFGVPVTDARSG
jgi:hypothetical protein